MGPSGRPDALIAPPCSQLGKRKRAACSSHARKARADFHDVLKKIGCLCKELISRNMDPCCRDAKAYSPPSRAMASLGANSSSTISAEDLDKEGDAAFGCISDSAMKDARMQMTPVGADTEDQRHERGTTGCIKAASYTREGKPCAFDGCHTRETPGCAPKHDTASTSKVPSCFNGIEKIRGEPQIADGSCCSKSCGQDEQRTNERRSFSGCDERVQQSSTIRAVQRVKSESDIEKGGSLRQHVSLTVEGLTCVGCETKLFRALSGFPGVRNLSTSLVLSRAEFDVDEEAGPVQNIIKAVEKSTGFACKQLHSEGQELDVLVDGDAKAISEREYPKGVTHLSVIDKCSVRIVFDPTIVGARAVVGNLFGCRLELATPRTSSDLESGQTHVRNTAWVTLLSAALTVPVLVLAWAPLPPRPIAYAAASLALATAVQFVIAGQFYVSALRALIFTRVIEMDLLVVLSTSTAYVCSIVAFAYQVIGHPLPIGEFFQTSTLLVTLIMLGRLVSAFARQKAVESVSLRSLQNQTAILCDIEGRNDQEIDARLLQYGDLFKVAPDSRVTTDGVVVMGSTEVDESMVTGESLPVDKQPGSSVIAGSINGSGVIVARLTNLPGHNTISQIAAMVDEAKFQKPKTQELVDIVAGYFVPVILVLTIITFVVWTAIGISVRHQGGGTAVVTAITYAVSVLIVSCPCAIGLCIPMVIVIAGGAAAKHGVVFKSALALESARKVSHVVFDKTGTLTEGALRVVEETILVDEQVALSVTLGLTSNSKHPVSAAISSHLHAKGIEVANTKDVRSITGSGVEGTYNGDLVRCGNTRWLSLHDTPEVQSLLNKALTVVGITIENKCVAVFGLADSIRTETEYVLGELKDRKIAISVVSGDDADATQTLATSLGIPLANVRSRCTPADKQEYLKTLEMEAHGTVIFCGDGTNDAVALAQADIGVHVSGGSEVAQTAADVVLVRPALTGVLVLLDLSRAAMQRVFLNFAWSFVYNLFAILLAAGAFVHARIPPQYAGLGEIVSVLPVILIALQLRWFKRDYEVRTL